MVIFTNLSKNIKNKSIGTKVLFLILSCGFFFAIAESCVQLYLDYKIDVEFVEEQIQQLQISFLKSIAKSTWNMEADEVKLQLEGALQLRDIKYIEVTTEMGDTLASAGIMPSQSIISHRFPLEYRHHGKLNSIGECHVVASLEGLYQRLYDKLLVIMVTRLLIALFISGFFLFVFQRLISRHLTKMAQYTHDLNLNNIGVPLILNRSFSKSIEPDELEKVVRAINGMQLHIQEHFAEIKLKEEALRKNEEQLKAIFEANPDPVVVYDTNGYPLYLNPAFTKIFGWSLNEVQGNRIPFVPEDQKEITKLKIKEIYESRNPIRFETKRLSKHGKPVSVLLSAAIIKGSQGINNGLVVNLRDITDQIKFEIQFRQSQKMEAIGTLAGGIAHDFNNILFPILGHTEMLLQDIPEDSSTHNSLKKIHKGAIRARDLVKQILIFSRQEKLELKTIRLQPIIKEAIKFIRSTIPATIEIKEDISFDCGSVKADSTQIHQIVMNLTTNAYHAMNDTGGKLKVSLKEIESNEIDAITSDMRQGRYACLTVLDTGRGMKKTLTDKIFDPFFTTKEKGKGTGMGLAVVHGIVAHMSGIIQVHSESGKGTHFNVYLPIERRISGKKRKQFEESIQGGTETILIVDDEEEIIIMEEQILKRLGYQVVPHTSSTEALEAFRAAPDRFDLIITDMAMPNLPGDKLSAELGKIRSDIPILLCTGFSETMSEEKAASLGIKDFLMKPILMKDLAKKIRDVLN